MLRGSLERGKNPPQGMGHRGRGTEAQREGDRDWVVVGCRETWGGIRDLERERTEPQQEGTETWRERAGETGRLGAIGKGR